ncbi:MAG: hypothetical protein R6X34_00680 [Chloroflexota bacterium]
MTASNTHWSSLYKIAGISALILLVYSLVTMALLVAVGGMPETAQEGFGLLTENRLVGLLRLDVLTILLMPLYYPLLLGLYGALRGVDGAKSLLSLVLGLAGVTLVLATPSAFSFLTLSDKFAAATDETQRTLLLAAGEAMLASDLWHSSGALVGGLLLQTATLILSLVMRRSADFSKVTAWVGVVMHGLDLLHIVAGFFVPAAGVALMIVAGPLYLVWFPLLARDFLRLARINRGN